VNFGAAIGSVPRGQHDEARVVDEAIGIFEAALVAVGDQGLAHLVMDQIDRSRRRQQMAAADMVVQEQP
jgi:hypothetical protein